MVTLAKILSFLAKTFYPLVNGLTVFDVKVVMSSTFEATLFSSVQQSLLKESLLMVKSTVSFVALKTLTVNVHTYSNCS